MSGIAVFMLGLVGLLGINGNAFGSSLLPDTGDYVESADTIFTVDRILIVGNKVTKESVILRELSLHPGDTVSSTQLAGIIERDKNKVYNLRLFNTASIRVLALPNNRIDLLIEISERWYIFPSPIFELSDRNFNEWWQIYDHDFSRVNYGLRLTQHNFRGRNETLRLTAQFGFTRRFNLSYRIPNLGKSQKHGLTFSFDYREPKNLAYFTDDHNLLYLESKETLKKAFGAGIAYSYRKSFYQTHTFSLEFSNSKVNDTIATLNPNYYANGSTHQRYFALSYSFNSDHRDVAAYPLKGFLFNGYISKIGLGFEGIVNQLESNVSHAVFLDLKKNFYLSNLAAVYFTVPTSQPYALYSALGYRQQFIRGYEVYVIEGTRFLLNKTTFKKRIFSHVWQLDYMPLSQFRHFPLSVYLKAYADVGYVQNYNRYEEEGINTRLSDRFLAGGGSGLDVVLLYDLVIRFEYTFTREGTQGFFFHLKKEF
jgi:outer membrane protein assembly factor BamA